MSTDTIPSFEIQALHTLLEREFEALKSQDFESFEALQERKQELLQFLLTEVSEGYGPEIEVTAQVIRDNQTLSDMLTECRDMQQRNELLINQKLQSIQGVLETLKNQVGKASSDTYEHLSKKKR